MIVQRMSLADIPRFLEFLRSTRENQDLGQYDTTEAVSRSLASGAGFLALDGEEIVGSMIVEMGMFGVVRREHAKDDETFSALLEAVQDACRDAGITRVQCLADEGTTQRSRMEARGFEVVGGVALIAKNL